MRVRWNIGETPEQMPVAVYGSLRTGGGNDRLWATIPGSRSEMVRAQDVRLRFDHPHFPYAHRESGAEAVAELVSVPAESWSQLIAALDRLEGHPNHYRREVGTVRTADGELVQAWVYLIGNRDAMGMREVPGNDWANVSSRVESQVIWVGGAR